MVRSGPVRVTSDACRLPMSGKRRNQWGEYAMRLAVVRYVAAMCGLAFLAAGCQSSGPESENQGWEEPGWMAEQADMRERFTVDVQSCMDSKGWELTVDSYGGFAEPFSSPEEREHAASDRNACLEQLGYDISTFDEAPSRDTLSSLYDRYLDTYECLVHEGVEMEQEPPSKEVWIEARLSGGEAWTPHLDDGVVLAGEERYAELEQLCPEPWPFAIP